MGKFQANVALMAGAMQMTSPKMKLNYSYTYERDPIWGGTNLKEYSWNQHADKSTALAGDVALKLQYRTGKRLSVFFSMDYMFSGFSFKGSVDNNELTTVYLTEDFSEYYKYQDSWTNDYSFKKNVSLLGLNAGISYLIF